MNSNSTFYLLVWDYGKILHNEAFFALCLRLADVCIKVGHVSVSLPQFQSCGHGCHPLSSKFSSSGNSEDRQRHSNDSEFSETSNCFVEILLITVIINFFRLTDLCPRLWMDLINGLLIKSINY